MCADKTIKTAVVEDANGKKTTVETSVSGHQSGTIPFNYQKTFTQTITPSGHIAQSAEAHLSLDLTRQVADSGISGFFGGYHFEGGRDFSIGDLTRASDGKKLGPGMTYSHRAGSQIGAHTFSPAVKNEIIAAIDGVVADGKITHDENRQLTTLFQDVLKDGKIDNRNLPILQNKGREK